MNLARDAQSAGDRIGAENYLQHAEHYFRIIAAAQAQMTPVNVPTADQPQASDPGAGGDADSGEGAQAAEGGGFDRSDGQPNGEPRQRRSRRRNGRGDAPAGQPEFKSPGGDGETQRPETQAAGGHSGVNNGAAEAHGAANGGGPETVERGEPAESEASGEGETSTTSV